jgi:YebC/PmpR family DNA-binding regulatory protein
MNFQLRLAVDKARAGNMPKDNIERAIARGAGGGGESSMEELVYEAYALGGTALIIECVTDNRNRTANEIKLILSKSGATLAGQGSVTYLFDHKGIIRTGLIPEAHRDEKELKLIEAGAEDIIHEQDGSIIVSSIADLSTINDAILQAGLTIISAGPERIPKTTIPIDSELESKVAEIMSKLEDHDDVTNVYTNAE